VKPEFLDSVHAGPGCVACHRGDVSAPAKDAAHAALVARPSREPERVCAGCHAAQVKNVTQSLHFTTAGLETVMRQRAADRWPDVEATFRQACQSCHASCGDCHVSKAASSRGGLMDGHVFLRRAPFEQACTTCHGGRVGPEYLGRNDGFPPDVHWQKGRMECVACHPLEQIHGDGTRPPDRFAVKRRPQCVGCHPTARAADSPIREHAVHGDKLACVVCHATAYRGCENCHVGTGAKAALQFKIGRTMRADAPYAYTLLRHVPAVRTMLEARVKGALPGYDTVPTWKDTTPHSIQRKTARAASCNNCHGNARLFLRPGDLHPDEAAANEKVAVPKVPERRP
jgi:thiosulfate/3-mercaptopyruvate sulfurtransferase